jgi:hypothetical protein
MNKTRNDFAQSVGIDKMTDHKTVGVDFKGAYIYTNNRVFLDSMYWPLIFASFGLLTPDINYQYLVFYDNECPAR